MKKSEAKQDTKHVLNGINIHSISMNTN